MCARARAWREFGTLYHRQTGTHHIAAKARDDVTRFLCALAHLALHPENIAPRAQHAPLLAIAGNHCCIQVRLDAGGSRRGEKREIHRKTPSCTARVQVAQTQRCATAAPAQAATVASGHRNLSRAAESSTSITGLPAVGENLFGTSGSSPPWIFPQIHDKEGEEGWDGGG